MSYRTRLALIFACVAAITALIIAVAVAIVWRVQFSRQGLVTPTDIAFRNAALWAVVIVAVIAVILASVAGLFFAKSFTRPLQKVTETAEALRNGDLKARTNLEGNDEVAQLGAVFDTMAAAVEKDRKLERRLTMDVAHELRTPLMAMQSTIEAMVDGVLPADEERLLTLNSEVVRLGRLVEALLRLARLENRSTPLKETKIDTADLISDLVIAHEMLIEDSGLTISFEGEPGAIVLGDKDMIRQCAANLISNAVRYTPAGGHIAVSVKKGDLMAQIAVSDTGIGISEEDIKHVFSRFWRADAGRTRETGGLGVGLAVVKEIVDRHHGWINVESVLNEGSTFTIYIPLYTTDARHRKDKVARPDEAKERRLRRENVVSRLRQPARFSAATAEQKAQDEKKAVADAAAKAAEEYARQVAASAAGEAQNPELIVPAPEAATEKAPQQTDQEYARFIAESHEAAKQGQDEGESPVQHDQETVKESEKTAEEYARQVAAEAAEEANSPLETTEILDG